jgi:TPR repeat protein
MVEPDGTPGSALRNADHNALEHSDRPSSLRKGKLRVFISYSRDDLNFADQLDAALQACGFECLIDRHGISGGENWKRRLGNLISEADTVVFLLSPSSAHSEICAWEVDEATRLGKRILPVICRSLEGASPPPRLQNLNYIFFHPEPKVVPGAGFGTGLASLIAALNTDFEWLREHTRYLQRAIEWDVGGRPTNRLLSGNDIPEAKAWAARRPPSAPEPTPLHLDFIRASEQEADTRASEQRLQLEAIAAAQAEREVALHQAETALKQAAVAQRKRARIRNTALVAVSFLAILLGLFVLAAIQQRQDADAILARATSIIVKFQNQMDIETRKEAVSVFERGANHGDLVSMENLAVVYDTGLWGVAPDYAKALEWHEKAAAKGNTNAMVSLGIIYENARDVARDRAKARAWFEKAAKLGNEKAKSHLEIQRQEYEAAEKGADEEDAKSMAELGMFYFTGRNGVERDHAKAREWYEKAAARGEIGAMVSLGIIYAGGYGVERDYGKAREWFTKAEKSGDEKATASLGAARGWFENKAQTGDANAMDNVGLFYADGLGVARDYTKAREWYEKGAAFGNPSARAHLEALPQ